MAVTKFVRAQDILKEKGFKAPPFDTAGFQNAVVEFFQKNDVSARLSIISVRFLDYEGAPACGFAASTEGVYNDYLGPGFDKYIFPHFLGRYFGGFEEYACSPYIIVDEPYVTNAVALLKMAGFIVSRKHKQLKHHAYTVTLV
uniref:Uncharacterized protein n=1 Tax=Siphoviridae sp. ctZro7 TaxID=2825561 RepID=A0A8S5PQN8_9CAUD|nr:MAG TPA: hypothetical protein [Siphoviridae sp. ctZro7]